MLRDLRHGFRVLMQAKGWTAVVVLSLAVGIGANAAIFTAVNGLMLQKLPVRDPDSVVRLRGAGDNDMMNNSSDYGSVADLPSGEKVQTTFSYPLFEHLRTASQTLSDLAASVPKEGVSITIEGRTETASALLTTGNYYEMLGVNARIGRTLATRLEVGTALYKSSRSVAGANTVLSRGLLIMQVSISLVLLVGAGLFLRTLDNLRSVEIGWNPQNLVFIRVDAEGAQLDNDGKLRFFQDAMDRLRAIPGVRHATVSKPTLMSGGEFGTGFYVQGRVYPKGEPSYVEGRDNINRVADLREDCCSARCARCRRHRRCICRIGRAILKTSCSASAQTAIRRRS